MSPTIPVRIMVLESWHEIPLQLDPGTAVGEAKRRALLAAHAAGQPEDYLVKYRGAEVPEGTTTVAQAGVVPNANLVVLRRRRQAVR